MAQPCILRSVQLGIIFQDPPRILTGVLQDLCVLKHIADFKIKNSALADPEKISRASQFQILTGDKESVIGMVQDVKPLFRLG